MSFRFRGTGLVRSAPLLRRGGAVGSFVKDLARGVVIGAGLSAVAWADEGVTMASPALTLYSPAPPSIMLHDHNVALGEALHGCGIPNTVVPQALPQSITQFADAADDEKKYHLPIVTTIDFLPAIHDGGPAWHSYGRPYQDLKFVSSLYDVAFGVLAFVDAIRSPEDLKGKRIAAPPRPSAVRVYTEALFRDGWGILEDVELIDLKPNEITAAINGGAIDATSWNLISLVADGPRPMVPSLLEIEGARWIPVSSAALRRLNDANAFQVSKSTYSPTVGDDVELLSFRQALAVWAATPDETVSAILACLKNKGTVTAALPRTPEAMVAWPGLKAEHMHKAALDFFANHGLKLD